MKLVCHLVGQYEIQEWLDKYGDKIKFIFPTNSAQSTCKIVIIIDEE